MHANGCVQTKNSACCKRPKEREMKTNVLKSLLLASCVITSAGLAHAADVTLNIESWRNDDLKIWQDKIIPAFEAKNPGIKVTFSPTAPTEYDAATNAKIDAGSA